MQLADIQKVLAGEEGFFELYSDDRYVAVLDTEPWTKGHTLVIPRKQFDSIASMSPQYHESMMKAAKKVVQILRKKLSAHSFHIMINEGDLTDPYNYVFLQVIPRFNKREMNIEHKQHIDRLEKIYSLIKH